MSVSLQKLLKLPSLKQAIVLTKMVDLDQSVTNLSFLEIPNSNFFNDYFQEINEYHFGELLIGSFYSIKNDVNKQCEEIKILQKQGDVGIILYYVGLIMPRVDQSLIDTANKINFALIQMPVNDRNLRYSEVIVEVMDSILRHKNNEFAVKLIQRISELPSNLQSVTTVLDMLADTLRASILLIDNENNSYSIAKWPRNSELNFKKIIWMSRKREAIQNLNVFNTSIKLKSGCSISLYLIKENASLTKTLCEQTISVVVFALNLWGAKQTNFSEHDLVWSLISNNEKRSYRIADKLKISLNEINTFGLLKVKNQDLCEKLKIEIRNYLKPFSKQVLIEDFVDEIIILVNKKVNKYFNSNLFQHLFEEYKLQIESLIVCPRLQDIHEVSEVFYLINNNLFELYKAFPYSHKFNYIHLKQVARVNDEWQNNRKEYADRKSLLDPIINNESYIKTLCTFLLDANSNYKYCGQLLYIHKNTVRYRIKKLNLILGIDLEVPSESYEYYLACIQYRLIH